MVDDAPLKRLLGKLHKKHKGNKTKVFREFRELVDADPDLKELLLKSVAGHVYEEIMRKKRH